MQMYEVAVTILVIVAASLLIPAIYNFFVTRHSKGIHDDAVIVITGGSAGIGLNYAKAIARRNRPKRIVLLARNPQTLSTAQAEVIAVRASTDTQVDVMVCDVSSEKECAVVARKVGPVDVLVNCAGLSYPTELENLTASQIQTMVNTNLMGSILLTRNVILGMKTRRCGTVAFVASQAAQAGLYGYTAYSATKFGVRGFAEALAMEAKPYGVKVCVLYPPDTNTDAYQRENEMKPKATRMMSESGLMEPGPVAEALRSGIEQGNFSIWCNFDGFMLTQLTAGFSPPNGVWHTFYQVFLISLFRLVAVCYRTYFDYIAKKCVAKNPTSLRE